MAQSTPKVVLTVGEALEHKMLDPKVIERLKKPRTTSEFDGAFAHVSLDDLNALLQAYETLAKEPVAPKQIGREGW